MDPRILRVMADDYPEWAVARSYPITTPAAGADWTFTVPGESVVGVFSIVATLVTSAAAANRVPTLRITDGSATLWRVGTGVAITATLTTVVSWLPELGYRDTALAGASLVVGTPPLYLASGQVVAVTTTALDAGDQWSAVSLSGLEVFHGRREAERDIIDRITERADAFAEFFGGQI